MWCRCFSLKNNCLPQSSVAHFGMSVALYFIIITPLFELDYNKFQLQVKTPGSIYTEYKVSKNKAIK